MKTSKEGLRLITQREGKVLHVYKDSQGYPTGGVGHLLTPAEKKTMPVGTPISEAQCQAWLKSDLAGCEVVVNGIGEKLSQNEFDACVSLAFNIGERGFARSTVARRLKAGDHKGAASAILLWNKPPEIQGRRRGEYHQFLTPYPNSAAPPSTAQPLTGDIETKSKATDNTPPPNPLDTNSGGTADITTTTTETIETPPVTTETTTTTTSNEPVTVKAVATGLWSKIVAAMGALTALGINAGTVIETKLADVTLNQVFIAGLSVGLLIVTIFYFKKRQEAADLKTHALIAAAANKEQNTVVLTK